MIKKTKKRQTKKRGRPVGSKTAERDQQVVIESRCRRCGSTDREPYTNPRSVPGGGVAPDGKSYTEVILSPTRCLQCGQSRTDRRYRNSNV